MVMQMEMGSSSFEQENKIEFMGYNDHHEEDDSVSSDAPFGFFFICSFFFHKQFKRSNSIRRIQVEDRAEHYTLWTGLNRETGLNRTGSNVFRSGSRSTLQFSISLRSGLTDEPDQTGPDLVEEAVELDPNCTLRRFWNKDHFKRFMQLKAIAATVVIGAYSESQTILWVIFLGTVYAVYAMESWAIPRANDIQPKWKVIIFGIAFTFTKLLSFYVLLYMLKPEWFSWWGFVIVFIIITAYKCSDELKTKFTWCCEKGVLVINYVINKVLKPIRNDQASPASAPTRASV